MTTAMIDHEALAMARERKKKGESEDRQITFRLPAELHARLEATAKGLGFDTSGVLRNMLLEYLPGYQARAASIAAKWAAMEEEEGSN